MESGIIGLGRICATIARSLDRNGHVVVHNRAKEKVTGARLEPPTVSSSGSN